MRINALTCIDHVLDSLDKMMILDDVLPFLMDITLGQDAKIVMAVVGMVVFKDLLTGIPMGNMPHANSMATYRHVHLRSLIS